MGKLLRIAEVAQTEIGMKAVRGDVSCIVTLPASLYGRDGQAAFEHVLSLFIEKGKLGMEVCSLR